MQHPPLQVLQSTPSKTITEVLPKPQQQTSNCNLPFLQKSCQSVQKAFDSFPLPQLAQSQRPQVSTRGVMTRSSPDARSARSLMHRTFYFRANELPTQGQRRACGLGIAWKAAWKNRTDEDWATPAIQLLRGRAVDGGTPRAAQMRGFETLSHAWQRERRARAWFPLSCHLLPAVVVEFRRRWWAPRS